MLGLLLRQARKSSGLSLRELAFRIGRDAPTLSRWESAERTPKRESVAHVLGVLGVRGERYGHFMSLLDDADEAYRVAATEIEKARQWAACLEFERAATRITYVSGDQLPELLCTQATLATTLRAEGVPDQDIEERVGSHPDRQRILTRHQPVALRVLLGAGAFQHDIGGPRIATAQWDYLAELSRLPNVDLRVLPAGSGRHAGTFTLVDSLGLRSALIGNRFAGVWVHRVEDVHGCERNVRSLRARALSPVDSRDRLVDAARRFVVAPVA